MGSLISKLFRQGTSIFAYRESSPYPLKTTRQDSPQSQFGMAFFNGQDWIKVLALLPRTSIAAMTSAVVFLWSGASHSQRIPMAEWHDYSLSCVYIQCVVPNLY